MFLQTSWFSNNRYNLIIHRISLNTMSSRQDVLESDQRTSTDVSPDVRRRRPNGLSNRHHPWPWTLGIWVRIGDTCAQFSVICQRAATTKVWKYFSSIWLKFRTSNNIIQFFLYLEFSVYMTQITLLYITFQSCIKSDFQIQTESYK